MADLDPLADAFSGLRTELRHTVIGPGAEPIRDYADRRTRLRRIQASAVTLALVGVAAGVAVTWPKPPSDPIANLGRPQSSVSAEPTDLGHVDWTRARIGLPALPQELHCPANARSTAQPLVFGDVDSDGRPDAVVPVECQERNPLVVVHLAPNGTVTGSGLADAGDRVRYKDAEIRDGLLTVGVDPPNTNAIAPTQQRKYKLGPGSLTQVTKYRTTTDVGNTTLPLVPTPTCEGGSVTFVGQHATSGPASFEVFSQLGLAQFGDLNGDGVSEVIAPITCHTPNGAAETSLYVLRLTDDGSSYVVLDTPYLWGASPLGTLTGWTFANRILTLTVLDKNRAEVGVPLHWVNNHFVS